MESEERLQLRLQTIKAKEELQRAWARPAATVIIITSLAILAIADAVGALQQVPWWYVGPAGTYAGLWSGIREIRKWRGKG